ncbi:MAG: cellulose synthase subunit BcsC-related outer membrane protein [Chromatocurvus sp.]
MTPARLATLLSLLLLQSVQAVAAAETDPEVTYRDDNVQRGEIPVAGPQTERIDLRTLWFHLNAGRLTAAREELERLRAAYPDWQPDADIRAALNPDTTPARDPYGERMQAIAALKEPALRALPASQLKAAAAAARTRGDGANLNMLAWRHLERDEPDAAWALFNDAATAGAPRDSEGRIIALGRLARAAARSGNVDRVAELSRLSSQEKGSDLLIDLLLDNAWTEREAGRLTNAEALFRAALPDPAAAEGLALTLRDRQQPDAALDIACGGASNSERLAQLCADWLDEALAAAYTDERYRDVLALSQRRQKLPDKPANATRELVAWSYYALGERDAAAAAFSEQLAQQPDNPGMAAALVNLLRDDRPALDAAAQTHPAVARVVRREAASTALARKQFDRAAGLDASPALENRGALSVALDLGRRERSGDRGLGELSHDRAALSISGVTDSWRLGGTLGWSDFGSGLPAADAAFGSRPAPDRFAPLDGVSDPSLHLWARHEGEGYSFYGRIGRDLWRQPAGEELSALFQARLFHDPFSGLIELFQQPIADSLLSRTGAVDPVDGAAWGGVMDRGVAGQATWSTTSDWHLSVNGSLSQQTGDEVEDNRAVAARIDLRSGWPGQHWRERLDYWQVGPFASWRGFDDNQFAFTRGSGGYFSPQDEYRVGLSSELLTAEGRRWQLRAGIEVAWTDISEDATAAAPRQQTRGVNVDARLQGHWLITPRLQLGARIQGTDARGFRGSYAGLTLRWFPQPRRAVWSRELQVEHRE